MKSFIIFTLCCISVYFGIRFVRAYFEQSYAPEASAAQMQDLRYNGPKVQFTYQGDLNLREEQWSGPNNMHGESVTIALPGGRGNSKVIHLTQTGSLNPQVALMAEVEKVLRSYYSRALNQFLSTQNQMARADFKDFPKRPYMRVSERTSTTAKAAGTNFRNAEMNVLVDGTSIIVPSDSKISNAYRMFTQTGRVADPEQADTLLFIDDLAHRRDDPFFAANAVTRIHGSVLLILTVGDPEAYERMRDQHQMILETLSVTKSRF